MAAAAAMNQADYRAAIRVVALLMLMLAPLAVLQHYSSQGSTINRQIDGDEESVFVVVAGVVVMRARCPCRPWRTASTPSGRTGSRRG